MDQTIAIWSINNLAAPPIVLAGNQRAVRALAFSPDSQMLAAADSDEVRLWNVQHLTGAPIIITGDKWSLTAIAFSPQDGILAVSGTDAIVRLLSVATPNDVVGELRGRQSSVSALAFRPDGLVLASGNDGGVVTMWDLSALRSATPTP
jgi:WD40 repeat protein